MIKRFGEISKPSIFQETEKAEIDDVLGKDIVVEDIEFLVGQWREFAVILFTFKRRKRKYSLAIGGKVVMRKLKEAKAKKLLPLMGKIIKIKEYYDIV